MTPPKITYDARGTPGILAPDEASALYGMGWLHGRHRPLQALLLTTAGRGSLCETILPRRDLLGLDALAQRLAIPERGRAEAARLSPQTSELVSCYVAGFAAGLKAGGVPFELRLLAARLPPLDTQGVLCGLMLSSYLGLAQCQERMEHLLIEAVCEGADPRLLERLFSPHLRTWRPDLLKTLPREATLGFASRLIVGAGGSNAWAVGGERSASGYPLLAGDPHLQINQLPALFFELRARVGRDYWLGATIPGLPGLAVGRNRHVAWSGTFSVADNVDFFVETLASAAAGGPEGESDALVVREVEIRRRFARPLRLRFYHTPRGPLTAWDGRDGKALAVGWQAPGAAAEALQGYLQLATAESLADAERALRQAHTLSLYFVVADRAGAILHCQAGRVPRRSHGWSGLFPGDVVSGARWTGFYEGEALPRTAPVDGFVASANELRRAADGVPLATLPQPHYRLERIGALLKARRDHDVASMMAMQGDLVSLQGLRLRSRLLAALGEGPVKGALTSWDGSCDGDSVGAHAFSIAYKAAVRALSPHLGGAWFEHALDATELGVWWCRALDDLLAADDVWRGPLGPTLARGIRDVTHAAVVPWGEVQQVRLRHMVLGGLPKFLGLDRGPFPLPGSIATVCQGNVLRVDGQEIAVGPAYRIVTDLGDDCAYTCLPGGVDGSRFCASYDRWLEDWRAGIYHRLDPPEGTEGSTTA